MATPVQQAFRTFHDTIKLSWNDEGELLRSKRDIVLEKLRSDLAKQFADRPEKTPTFTPRNQGSYAMGTGVKPLSSDYDIDVALLFNISVSDYPDPTEVKGWVNDALQGHTELGTEVRRHCVTVWYKTKGELAYHLDLAVYSAGGQNPDGKTYLAKGYKGSDASNKEWMLSDPMELVQAIDGRFDGDARLQFRRTVCALKRWKDYKFSSTGEAAPRGIGLTAAAYRWFQHEQVVTDPWAGTAEDDDLAALLALVNAMLQKFQQIWHDGEYAWRLKAPLPVEPFSDPFERMSNKQMLAFHTKLEALRDALTEAQRTEEPEEACAHIQTVLGEDFPVPDKPSTGKKVAAAIISANQSA